MADYEHVIVNIPEDNEAGTEVRSGAAPFDVLPFNAPPLLPADGADTSVEDSTWEELQETRVLDYYDSGVEMGDVDLPKLQVVRRAAAHLRAPPAPTVVDYLDFTSKDSLASPPAQLTGRPYTICRAPPARRHITHVTFAPDHAGVAKTKLEYTYDASATKEAVLVVRPREGAPAEVAVPSTGDSATETGEIMWIGAHAMAAAPVLANGGTVVYVGTESLRGSHFGEIPLNGPELGEFLKYSVWHHIKAKWKELEGKGGVDDDQLVHSEPPVPYLTSSDDLDGAQRRLKFMTFDEWAESLPDYDRALLTEPLEYVPPRPLGLWEGMATTAVVNGEEKEDAVSEKLRDGCSCIVQ